MTLTNREDAEVAHIDVCTCGHVRTAHNDIGRARGAGHCFYRGCKCERFTWSHFSNEHATPPANVAVKSRKPEAAGSRRRNRRRKK